MKHFEILGLASTCAMYSVACVPMGLTTGRAWFVSGALPPSMKGNNAEWYMDIMLIYSNLLPLKNKVKYDVNSCNDKSRSVSGITNSNDVDSPEKSIPGEICFLNRTQKHSRCRSIMSDYTFSLEKEQNSPTWVTLPGSIRRSAQCYRKFYCTRSLSITSPCLDSVQVTCHNKNHQNNNYNHNNIHNHENHKIHSNNMILNNKKPKNNENKYV